MNDEFNPYKAPAATTSDDFIAVEPIRRPLSNFTAAAFSFGCATFLLAIEGIFTWIVINLWSRAGTKAENHPTQLGWRGFMLVTIGCSGVAFLFAGHSYWRMQDRRGRKLFLTAIGLFAATFLGPLLFR